MMHSLVWCGVEMDPAARPVALSADLQLSGGVGAIRPLLGLDGCVWISATRLPGLGVDPQSSDGVGRGASARSAAVSVTP